MQKKITSIGMALLCMSILSSCETVKKWGEKDEDTELHGTRIPALETTDRLQPDKTVEALPVTVPDAAINASWPRTQGYQSEEIENLAFPSHPEIKERKNIAKMEGQYPAGAGPLVVDDRIYSLDTKGVVRAFDRAKLKKPLWSYAIIVEEKKQNDEPFLNGGMTYDHQVLYITTGKNTILALNASDGTLLWKRKVNNMLRSAPAVSGGMLFVTTMDNHLYALSSEDGSIAWIHAGLESDMAVLGAASPVVVGDVVLVTYSSGEIFALQSASGNVVWSDSILQSDKTSFLLSDIDASPVIYKHMVLTASQAGTLTAWDISGGLKIWQQSIFSVESPWVAGDFIYVLTQDSQVICLYAPTGAIRWVSRLPAYKNEETKKDPYSWHGPIMAGGELWIVGAHGQLLALSPTDGKIISHKKVPTRIDVAPVVAQETMYLLREDGELVELR